MGSFAAFRDELLKIAACRGRMTVAQSRSGRRPMRVATMLQKEKDGSLFKAAEGSSVGELINKNDQKADLPVIGTVSQAAQGAPAGGSGLQPATEQAESKLQDSSDTKLSPEEYFA